MEIIALMYHSSIVYAFMGSRQAVNGILSKFFQIQTNKTTFDGGFGHLYQKNSGGRFGIKVA